MVLESGCLLAFLHSRTAQQATQVIRARRQKLSTEMYRWVHR